MWQQRPGSRRGPIQVTLSTSLNGSTGALSPKESWENVAWRGPPCTAIVPSFDEMAWMLRDHGINLEAAASIRAATSVLARGSWTRLPRWLRWSL
eukprot:3082655-Amphidinium_carterae.1